MACIVLWQLDAGWILPLQSEVALVLGVDQQQQIVGTDLFNIGEGLVLLVQMDQPGKALRVGSYDIVFVL
jgi:hypothetical protein